MNEETLNEVSEENILFEYKTDYSFSYKESNIFSMLLFVSCFFVFLGIDCDHKEAGIPDGNVFLVNDIRKTKQWNSQSLDDLLKSKTFNPPYVMMSNHNHYWKSKENKSTFIITLDCNYLWFEKWKSLKVRNRGNDYNEAKDFITEKVMKMFYKKFPKLEQHVQVCFSATPLSVQFFLNYGGGETYGIEQCSDRYLKWYDAFIKKNPIKNLHFAGQDCFFSHGITPSLYSSLFACEKILGKDLFTEAEKAQKISNKKDTV